MICSCNFLYLNLQHNLMTMKKFVICTLLNISLLCSAQTLDELAHQVALNNPALAAAQHRYASQMESFRAENVLEGPEADFDYKFNSSGGDDRWGFSIAQGFDWPGVYAARKLANGFRTTAFEQLAAADYLNAKLEAKEAIIRCAAAEQQLNVTLKAYKNVTDMRDAYKKAYEIGQATLLDVKKLELEVFNFSMKVNQAEAALNQAMNDLSALNGGKGSIKVPDFDTFDIPELLPYPVYREQYASADPTLAANNSLVKSATADVKASKMASLPSFKIGFVHDFEENMHFNGFSVGISLPQWAPKHKVAAARLEALGLQADSQAYTINVNCQLSCDFAEAQSISQTSLAMYSKYFADDSYCELLKKSLDLKNITILDYLRECNEFMDAKIEFIAQKEAFMTAMARLNKYN